jgi:hypothetical protein
MDTVILDQLPPIITTSAATAKAASVPPIYTSTVDLPASPSADGPLTSQEANKMSTISLRNAKRLYQPVKGSSSGSRYACVAIGPHLKVGARVVANKALSVRVEGEALGKYSKPLSDAGFTVKTDYASIHLDIEGLDLVAKTLGAVLMAVGDTFNTPMPNLKTLKELTYA